MRFSLALLLGALLAAIPVHAQTTFASISGRVADPSGAVVPGVTVQATNNRTGYEYRAQSNESGAYTIPQLLEGTYTLRASAAGFQEFVAREIVLASRAQLGYAWGPDDLLVSDRFRAGGATTVRGYGEDSLGPKDVAGLPAGGDRLLILNQEIRFPMKGWFNGVAFVDAGNIAKREEEFGSLKIGYGFGLRLDTPVGLLRGDVGFPRNDVVGSGKKTRFYFGFGHIF